MNIENENFHQTIAAMRDQLEKFGRISSDFDLGDLDAVIDFSEATLSQLTIYNDLIDSFDVEDYRITHFEIFGDKVTESDHIVIERAALNGIIQSLRDQIDALAPVNREISTVVVKAALSQPDVIRALVDALELELALESAIG